MDKRRSPRFEADQSVTITLLRDPETKMAARVTNASGKGLGLIAENPVPQGTALKIALEDTIVLGEAVYCTYQSDGWLIGVELNQVLTGLCELGRRLQEYAPIPSEGEALQTVDHRQT